MSAYLQFLAQYVEPFDREIAVILDQHEDQLPQLINHWVRQGKSDIVAKYPEYLRLLMPYSFPSLNLTASILADRIERILEDSA